MEVISEKKRSLIKQMTVLCGGIDVKFSTDLTAYNVPSIIYKPEGAKFLWSCYRGTTNLLWIEDIDKEEQDFNIALVEDYKTHNLCLDWYYYNGEVLRPVTLDEILTGKFWEA